MEPISFDKLKKGVLKHCKPEGQAIQLSTVETKSIKWLHPGRIPRGKITILAGDPDVGKTFLTLDIASRVSTGTTWPDGAPNEAGNVLILSAEDDLADTIVPRLKASKANLNQILALTTVRKRTNNNELVEAVPTLTDDLDTIEKEISIHEPKLIIIDPINAYLPGVDTHRDAELRTKVFAPLKKLAEDNEIAVLCVMHLNKSNSQSAKHRVSGSIAYVAASRATWLITNDKDDHSRKLMIPVKFNIGPKPDGLAYKIIENDQKEPVIAWEADPIEIDPDEALSHENESSAPEREYAKEFLLQILDNGAVPAEDIFSEAETHDITKRTLKRAKEQLKVEAIRRYEKGKRGVQGWSWKLREEI
ncbi:MAG TPA: AAA family ATPase [Balneolaceae bacterium]